jgi:MFS family permease
MNQPLLRIDEGAAQSPPPADLPAVRTNDRNAGASEPAWAAVGVLALGVFSLVTAEFLPASLLTPIAADFRISEGVAGQTVSATAIFALLSSLIVTAVIRNLDRRTLMLGFTILLLISNLIAAFAFNFPMLLIGRVLLGLALGGFWAMSAALTMRLVPEESYRGRCRSSSAASRPPPSSQRRLESPWGIFSAGAPCSLRRRVCP